jgi:hypothetical protein
MNGERRCLWNKTGRFTPCPWKTPVSEGGVVPLFAVQLAMDGFMMGYESLFWAKRFKKKNMTKCQLFRELLQA